MTLNSLVTINLLIVLGLAVAIPAIVGGIMGLYFQGRADRLSDLDDKRSDRSEIPRKPRSSKLASKADHGEFMSLTDALDPNVVKKPRKNSRIRRAA